ncbi:hypothetical protein [Hyphomicrobium sp.]|uniref:hypothetical protein n=1 Tax=Hyphomicrobium sp. TaxID=82 RepID=UPI0025C56502|nr:hypothetical protein [Hyphomicrobium sp.]MCC7251226.1 hypothetical protein [Hyphomicrobium sp.]
MIRSLTACAAALCLAGASAHAGDATTTRIVPYNAYGATVTVEHGVRVFRPLPPEGHVIVNPGNRTPLSLNVYEPGVPVIRERR